MKEYVAFIGGKMCFGTACAQRGDAKRWIGCLRLRRSRCFFKLYFTSHSPSNFTVGLLGCCSSSSMSRSDKQKLCGPLWWMKDTKARVVLSRIRQDWREARWRGTNQPSYARPVQTQRETEKEINKVRARPHDLDTTDLLSRLSHRSQAGNLLYVLLHMLI